MIKVYGIKTCTSVQKALKFFKNNDIETHFIDIRKDVPSSSIIQNWINQSDINILFNSKGTKYRTLKLKDLNLDDNGKFKWLCNEPMLLKRPIIDDSMSITVGFDIDVYKSKFI